MTSDTGNDRHNDRSGSRQTPDDAFDARLRDLDARLRKAKRAGAVPESARQRGSALGFAFRLVVELVVGLVVGGGIGWLLDKALGTLPIMLLVFFTLGAAAGIFNVIRTARQMQAGISDTGRDLSDEDDAD